MCALIRAILVVSLSCVGGGVAVAQPGESGDIAVSYSFLRVLGDGGVNAPAGWLFSAARDISPWEPKPPKQGSALAPARPLLPSPSVRAALAVPIPCTFFSNTAGSRNARTPGQLGQEEVASGIRGGL